MKMTTLFALKRDDIFEVFDYIEKFTPEGMDKKEFALAQIGKFFVDLPIEKEIELYNIISSRDMLDMDNFIKQNPLLKVNLDGDSQLDGTRAVRAKELSLKMSYNEALKAYLQTKSKLAKAIIDAYTLKELENHKLYAYSFEKTNIYKYIDTDTYDKISIYEEKLKDIIDVETFLSLVFEYGRRTKVYEFVKYVFYHLDVIYQTLDSLSDLSKEYISKINEITSKFKNTIEQ